MPELAVLVYVGGCPLGLPMSTEDALLAAVRSAPDDDLPRLVYADWLEENGDADRAEFIRVQVERAKGPPRTPPTARENELYDAHRERWYGDLLRLLNAVPLWAAFRNNIRRGFVAELYLLNGGNWTADRLTPFLDSPHVALTSLTLRSNDGDDLSAAAAAALFADTRLECLESLQFHELVLPAEAMAVVVTCPHLTRLHTLAFWSGYYLDGPIQALVEHFDLPSVRTLRMSNVGLRDAEVELLAGCPRLSQLTALDLGGNSFVTDAGVTALANSAHLTGLTRLTMTGRSRLTPATKAKLRARFGDGLTV